MSERALSLVRVAVRPDGAFGVLKHHAHAYDPVGTPFAVTLERTYPSFAEAGISERYQQAGVGDQFVKIPHGLHRCRRSFFNRGGYWTFEILVPGHTRILFHKGNSEAHSEGCVLVAERFEPASGLPGVLDGAGFVELMQRCAQRGEFDLEVRAA